MKLRDLLRGRDNDSRLSSTTGTHRFLDILSLALGDLPMKDIDATQDI